MSYAKVEPSPATELRLGEHSLGEAPIPCTDATRAEVQRHHLPIYTGRMNRWLVEMRGPENMTAAQITTHIKALFDDFWFSAASDRPTINGIKVGIAVVAGVVPVPWKTVQSEYADAQGVINFANSLNGPPIASAPYPLPFSFPDAADRSYPAFALVSFLYVSGEVGKEEEYFYPTFNGTPDWDCPNGVNTFVSRVYQPLSRWGKGGSAIAEAEASSGTSKWVIPLVAAGVGLYFVRKFAIKRLQPKG